MSGARPSKVAVAKQPGLLILLALGMGLWALYLWLQLELGTFAALGILGGAFALTLNTSYLQWRR